MSIRLDPRRLSALKLLAAEAGMRPGELVTKWVEERLDAARAGGAVAAPTAAPAPGPAALDQLRARLDEIERRLDAMASSTGSAPKASKSAAEGTTTSPPEPKAESPAPKRRGRPPKSASSPRPKAVTPRVPLHEEIAAVIGERGPLSAADLAAAIAERGRYAPPRSSKPLDAATVNSRVSNPAYRSRFVRRDGRIDLATGG